MMVKIFAGEVEEQQFTIISAVTFFCVGFLKKNLFGLMVPFSNCSKAAPMQVIDACFGGGDGNDDCVASLRACLSFMKASSATGVQIIFALSFFI